MFLDVIPHKRQSDLIRHAYTHGQSWWREHPSEHDAIFAGYGYRVIEQDGVWSRGFERSAFQADGVDPASWWMDSFGGVVWQSIGLAPPVSTLAQPRVHIVGYLSPKGRYRHLGAMNVRCWSLPAVLQVMAAIRSDGSANEFMNAELVMN